MAPVNLFVEKHCSSDLKTSTPGPSVDPSIYESLASMTTLGPSDVVTTDVAWGDDKETLIKR